MDFHFMLTQWADFLLLVIWELKTETWLKKSFNHRLKNILFLKLM